MTKEEAKRRLLDIERCTPIHTREDVRDFEALEMAIKALEQEPCEDAIDLDMKLKLMEANINGYTQGLKDASNTEQEPKWISVSERLPEKNTAVLTYVSTGPSKTYCLAYWNDVREGWEEWIGYELIERDRGYKVLAWMPLPEQYKAESEE